MIKTQNTGIKHAIRVVREMNLGQELRWLYEDYWKAKRDRRAEDAYVRAEGKAEGKAEAILKLLGRFGDVPPAMQTRIMEEGNLETLDNWLDAAMEAHDLEEVQRQCKIDKNVWFVKE